MRETEGGIDRGRERGSARGEFCVCRSDRERSLMCVRQTERGRDGEGEREPMLHRERERETERESDSGKERECDGRVLCLTVW